MESVAMIEAYSADWTYRLFKTLASVFLVYKVVMNRREFTDGIVTYLSMLSLWPIPVGLFLYSLINYPARTAFGYLILFLGTHRRDARHTGSQVSSWLGRGWGSKILARYLQSNLHVPSLKAIQDFAASGGRLIFAVHPHSMFGISTLINFALNRLETRSVFGPSIDFRVCTINLNFWIPVLREYLMARGFVCADRSTFSTLLNRGISPVIVPGGAEETLYAYPGSADLVVKKRMGFVREAILNNAALVPVYCFGDNEAVPVYRTKAILKLQRIIQKWLTFATPFVIPYFTRSPIHMVVGSPLPAPPAGGTIEERARLYHSQYLEALEKLFKQYVNTHGTTAEKKGKGIRFIK